MRSRKLALVVALLFAGSVFGNAKCSEVQVLDDGTYVVTDCWGKSECKTWSTKDADLAARWVGNAYMDAAMC
jgi:hypothetical protein